MIQGDRFPRFMDWLFGWVVFGLVAIAILMVAGCSSPVVSEPKYPEYDKWWETGAVPRQVIAFDGPYASVSYVVDVIGRDGRTNSVPVEVTPI